MPRKLFRTPRWGDWKHSRGTRICSWIRFDPVPGHGSISQETPWCHAEEALRALGSGSNPTARNTNVLWIVGVDNIFPVGKKKKKFKTLGRSSTHRDSENHVLLIRQFQKRPSLWQGLKSGVSCSSHASSLHVSGEWVHQVYLSCWVGAN